MPLRLVASLLIPVMLMTSVPVQAWESTNFFSSLLGKQNPSAKPVDPRFAYPQVERTPTHVKVNKTVPKVKPPPEHPEFSKWFLSEEEIYQAHVFEEPLVPMGGKTTREENKALSEALRTYLQNGGGEKLEPILEFMRQYPASPWRPALLTDVGIVYRKTGYFCKALTAWEQAWEAGKRETEPRAKAIIDRAFGELVELNARLGRFDTLQGLFKDAGSRDFRGPASEKVAISKEGLWLMQNQPEKAFRCGPLAVTMIQKSMAPSTRHDPIIDECKSTQQGISLARVLKLTDDLKMNFQAAKRTPGSDIIVPSLIHWKAGHYAAVVQEQGGRYLIQDPTFGDDIWVSRAAIDEEATGYFLIPKQKLSPGWAMTSRQEAEKVYGKGSTSGTVLYALTLSDAVCFTCPPADSPSAVLASPLFGMAQYNVHALMVNLTIRDTPVGYAPPKGFPINFTVVYNHRDSFQPSNFTYSNLGPKWTFDWLTYITDDPNNQSADAKLYVHGGGQETYTGYNSTNSTYATQFKSRSILKRTSATSYQRTMTDGTIAEFSQPDGASSYPRKVFLTKLTDPSGNAVSLTYDSKLRIVAISDSLGQVTTLSYNHPTDIYKITRVTDPFGRYAAFDYNSSGQLSRITDTIGLPSEFTYGASDFISSMTTPYGTSTFSAGSAGTERWMDIVDPMGQKERVLYHDNATATVAGGPVPSGFTAGNYGNRSTFYFDKQTMKEGRDSFANAKHYHWLHDVDTTLTSNVIESERSPLENRVWYQYPGQTNDTRFLSGSTKSLPSRVARVLDDATEQNLLYEYNDLGKVTKTTDPAGRVISYTYSADGIDLLEVRQTTGSNNDLLASFTYNSQHLPLTATDAAGQITYFTFNSSGQVTQVRNPNNEKTTFTYNPSGYLANITGPVSGATTSFSYDGYGRVRTVTDSEGYVVTTDYDAADRPTLITYPDGTTEQIGYDRLDADQTKDRLNRWSRTFYDAIRRPVTVQDALGRVTQLGWCDCGSLESITDPLGQTTTWIRDLQGRPTQKLYPDGKIIGYTYETATSRLKSVTDAKGQTANYQYFVDNNLKQVAYSNAVVATPTVSFTYATNYNRVTNMVDGTGTTSYGYNAIGSPPAFGAGKLAAIDGPLSNDTITFNYDKLGRVTGRGIGSSTNTVSYDSLGRATNTVNSLGSFTYAYTNTTARLSSVSYPNGQITTFDYNNNNGDQRLKQIWNKNGSSATISKFDYEYNAEGQINKWTQQADAATPTVHEFEYDYADQLSAAVLKNQSSGALIKRYAYVYDKAGNRTGEQIDNVPTQASFNSANQMTANQSSGPLRFKGSINETGTVTVAGIAAKISTTASATNTFISSPSSTVGTNVVTVIATDYSSNARTNNYQVVVTNLINSTLTYDNNGNTTSDGTRTYEWDAADRLTKITQSTNYVAFSYDGLGRRVQLVDVSGSTTNANKRFVWNGTQIAEERDSAGSSVTKRFETQGVEDSGTDYFYTRDHLGSVREVVNSANSVQARYDYDPYGRRIKVSGSYDADFGYTGHFEYKPSWMSTEVALTLYRVYDPELGRWLSRDPLGEDAGLNLYSYVHNDPINFVDLLGLLSAEETQRILDQAVDNALHYNGFGGFLVTTPTLIAANPFAPDWTATYDTKIRARAFDPHQTGFRVPECDKPLRDDEFGNYLAGYITTYVYGELGYLSVSAGGHLYSLAEFGTPDDEGSRTFINMGADAARLKRGFEQDLIYNFDLNNDFGGMAVQFDEF